MCFIGWLGDPRSPWVCLQAVVCVEEKLGGSPDEMFLSSPQFLACQHLWGGLFPVDSLQSGVVCVGASSSEVMSESGGARVWRDGLGLVLGGYGVYEAMVVAPGGGLPCPGLSNVCASSPRGISGSGGAQFH